MQKCRRRTISPYLCGTFEKNLRRSRMDEKQPQPQPGQMQIKADEKELQGLYSNLVMLQHNLEEFTLNFVYIFPNGAQGKLLSSMCTRPGTLSHPTLPLYAVTLSPFFTCITETRLSGALA